MSFATRWPVRLVTIAFLRMADESEYLVSPIVGRFEAAFPLGVPGTHHDESGFLKIREKVRNEPRFQQKSSLGDKIAAPSRTINAMDRPNRGISTRAVHERIVSLKTYEQPMLFPQLKQR